MLTVLGAVMWGVLHWPGCNAQLLQTLLPWLLQVGVARTEAAAAAAEAEARYAALQQEIHQVGCKSLPSGAALPGLTSSGRNRSRSRACCSRGPGCVRYCFITPPKPPICHTICCPTGDAPPQALAELEGRALLPAAQQGQQPQQQQPAGGQAVAGQLADDMMQLEQI